VMKNFPSEARMRELLGSQVSEFEWTELDYFWTLSYRLR